MMKDIMPDYYEKPNQASCLVVQTALMSGLADELEIAYMFNIAKYLYRWKNKNGIEDLVKARTYLNMLIERENLINDERHTY